MLKSTAPGGASANTSAAVAWSALSSRPAGAVASNPRDHQVRLPVLNSVSSTAHPGSVASGGTATTASPPASRNRAIRRLLRIGAHPAGLPPSRVSELSGNDHFCQDWMRPRARPGMSRIPGLP
jgi:hypothetical protein